MMNKREWKGKEEVMRDAKSFVNKEECVKDSIGFSTVIFNKDGSEIKLKNKISSCKNVVNNIDELYRKYRPVSALY